MFQRIVDDVKDSTRTALQLSSLAVVIAIASFITLAFLCAAAFVAVLQAYGLVQACLAGAAFFFIVAVVALAVYSARRTRASRRAAERPKPPAYAALADPTVMAIGLQLARTIGAKRLIPLLAVGGIALGLLASRHTDEATPAE
jgi:membrane associated rhomboid family serine protease